VVGDGPSAQELLLATARQGNFHDVRMLGFMNRERIYRDIYLKRLAQDRSLLERLAIAAKASSAKYNRDEMVRGWMAACLSALETGPRKPSKKHLAPRSTYGRLERLGLPPVVIDSLRHARGKWFKHASGSEEWPDSLSTDAELKNRIADRSLSTRLNLRKNGLGVPVAASVQGRFPQHDKVRHLMGSGVQLRLRPERYSLLNRRHRRAHQAGGTYKMKFQNFYSTVSHAVRTATHENRALSRLLENI
jgi:hypothetical protein